ncbi:MAG: hypothetical protein WBX15_06710 [Thermoanaerobaculia bacterium]
MTRHSISISLVIILLALAAATSVRATCGETTLLMRTEICVTYHTTGETNCHFEYEWIVVGYCDVSAPYYPPGGGGGSGTGTVVDPPPQVSIVSVSDYDIYRPVVRLEISSDVTSMDLLIGGSLRNGGLAASTLVALPPVDEFPLGLTMVSFRVRDALGQTMTADMSVSRIMIQRSGETLLHAVWTVPKVGEEPVQEYGEWTNTVTANLVHTVYDVQTVHDRNGEHQHRSARQRLIAAAQGPTARIEGATYSVSAPDVADRWQAYPCPATSSYGGTVCYDPNTFARGGEPNATVFVDDIGVFGRAFLVITILDGHEVTIAP